MRLNLELLKEICETPGAPGFEERIRKVVFVVLLTLAESYSDRQSIFASTCTSDTLLIVKSARRHVGHHNRRQSAYIHASLHSRCYAQYVDAKVLDGVFTAVEKSIVATK